MNNTVDTDGALAAGGLIPSVSIEALLRRRDAAIEHALQAVALLREGQRIAQEGGFGFLDVALNNDTTSDDTTEASDSSEEDDDSNAGLYIGLGIVVVVLVAGGVLVTRRRSRSS
jgi:hypothetical protein